MQEAGGPSRVALQVIRQVNGCLAPLSETYNSGFLEELWQSIEDVVKVRPFCEKD